MKNPSLVGVQQVEKIDTLCNLILTGELVKRLNIDSVAVHESGIMSVLTVDPFIRKHA